MGRPARYSPPGTPRWVKLSGSVAGVLLLVFVLHLVVMRSLIGFGPTGHM
jgi:hypothetical protein